MRAFTTFGLSGIGALLRQCGQVDHIAASNAALFDELLLHDIHAKLERMQPIGRRARRSSSLGDQRAPMMRGRSGAW
jgi:hypothetical protein